jgi:FtsP/CotA-like multicopper oxidase with cupredoxin domain
MKRLLLALAILPIFSATAYAQDCASNANAVANPEIFQWEKKSDHFFGVLQMGEATFDINGETLTTRAYRQVQRPDGEPEVAGDYSIPGPTIVMEPGEKYVLRFENTLPYQPKVEEHNIFKDPNVTNVHTHGLHISGETPGDDVTRFFEGGFGGDYVYEIPENHMGGTYWYHAHHHGSTFLQVSSGAFGLIIIDDAGDGMPDNVAAMTEQHLALGFLEPGNSKGTGGDSLISGTFSTGWTLNGSAGGDVCIPANTWQHWRMLVADQDARLVDLEIGAGCEVGLLSRDGVWRTQAPSILTDNTLTLTGASRAGLAVRCNSNSSISVAGTQVANIVISGTTDETVGPYDLSAGPTATWSALRPVYLHDLRDKTPVDTDSIRMGARSVLGRKFDKVIPNLTKNANGVQEWSLNGATNHPFHLHIYHVQVQNDCGPFEAGEFYDVIAGNCDLRFDMSAQEAYEGRTIFHCHILAHEDQGAMGWMDVIGGRPPPIFPGDGDYKNKFSLGGTTPLPPSAPTGLGASAVSTSQIDLAWTDTSGDETAFSIDRSDDGVNYTSIASPGANVTTYSNTGLAADQTYYYQVAAVNGAGPSDYSNTATAKTQAAGAGTSIAVGSITVSTVSGSKGFKFGQATVVVVDDVGNPVPYALVTGDFIGDINQEMIEDQADVNGISTKLKTSTSVKGLRSLQFCVTAITAPDTQLTPYAGGA